MSVLNILFFLCKEANDCNNKLVPPQVGSRGSRQIQDGMNIIKRSMLIVVFLSLPLSAEFSRGNMRKINGRFHCDRCSLFFGS